MPFVCDKGRLVSLHLAELSKSPSDLPGNQ
jgi:hypothetical protein